MGKDEGELQLPGNNIYKAHESLWSRGSLANDSIELKLEKLKTTAKKLRHLPSNSWLEDGRDIGIRIRFYMFANGNRHSWPIYLTTNTGNLANGDGIEVPELPTFLRSTCLSAGGAIGSFGEDQVIRGNVVSEVKVKITETEAVVGLLHPTRSETVEYRAPHIVLNKRPAGTNLSNLTLFGGPAGAMLPGDSISFRWVNMPEKYDLEDILELYDGQKDSKRPIYYLGVRDYGLPRIDAQQFEPVSDLHQDYWR